MCRACCIAYESIKEFNFHINSHQSPIACKKCSTITSRDMDFHTHRHFHKSAANIYACMICKTYYTSVNYLIEIYCSVLLFISRKDSNYSLSSAKVADARVLVPSKSLFLNVLFYIININFF